MRGYAIVFLAIVFLPVWAARTVQSAPAEDWVEVYGTINTEIVIPVDSEFSEKILHPVYLARVMLISGSDTLSTFSKTGGQYHIIFPRPEVTGIENQTENSARAVQLHQNYPNPFNPSTVIAYQLFDASEVSLTVYSITGQKIRTLESGYKRAGSYSVIWNGCDERGSSVSAGVYLYQLRAGKQVDTRKMLLIDGGGIVRAAKPVASSVAQSRKTLAVGKPYEIAVIRDGYAPYRETGFYLPESGRQVEKNVVIENRSPLDNFSPLDAGDSWEFISARRTFMVSAEPESLVSEQKLRVTETRMIEGKKYSVLSCWTPFLPDVFHSDLALPLVRISDDGYFILRYGDVDFPLYRFRVSGSSQYIDLQKWIAEHSINPEEYSALYNPLKGIKIITSMGYNDEPVNTPAGVYEDGRRIEVEVDRSTVGGGVTKSTIWFSRGVGPVYAECPGDSVAPVLFLKRAAVSGKNYGVLPGVSESGTVTGTDLREMFRIAFSEMRQFIWDYNVSFPGTVFPVACDPEYAALLPEIGGFPLVYRDLESLLAMERSSPSYLFITISEDYDPVRIETNDPKIRVPLTVFHPIIVCSGYMTEFQRKFGMWVGSIRQGWVVKPAVGNGPGK